MGPVLRGVVVSAVIRNRPENNIRQAQGTSANINIWTVLAMEFAYPGTITTFDDWLGPTTHGLIVILLSGIQSR
jgi:hypothetical protein